jgi:hypothetical protein
LEGEVMGCFIGGLLSGIVLGVILGFNICGPLFTDYEAKAVAHGVATWVVDQATGKTTFTWKDGE